MQDGKYPFYIRSDVPVRSNRYLYDEEAVITIGDGNIGRVFHYVNGKFDLHQRCYKMADFKALTAKYFYYYFSTKFYERAMSMTAKATVDSVRLEMISDMEIKFPKDTTEQTIISELLTNLDNLITLHQRKFNDILAYKLSVKFFFFNFTKNVWEQRKFDTLAKVDRGLTYSPNNLANNGIRVLRSSNINDDQFKLYDEDVFVTPNSINIEYANNNDILITSANGSSRLVGKHTIIKGISSGSTVHGGFMLLARPYINSHFLNASMSSSWYKKFIDLYVAGGNGAIGNLSKTDLDNQIVNIPNESEINKIGDLFKNIDNLITLHHRKYTYIFYSWEQRELFDVADYRNGKAHENDIDDDGKYIVINSKFVSTEGKIKKYSNKQNEPLFQNEIAFVLSDVPNGRAIAKTFLVDKSSKYTLNQRIAGITPHSNINPKFLSITMNRNKYFLQFDDGVKQTNLSLNDMKKFEEFYPNKQEQDKIGELFTNLDNLITLHQHKELERRNNNNEYLRW